MPKRKTTEEYIQECKERGLDLPVEEYKGAKIKIKHKCKDGHIYYQRPDSHLRREKCSKCNSIKMNMLRRKTSEKYYQECKEKSLDLPIEDYINSSTKIKHKCSKGHIYEQTPSDHLQKYGCPICNESHGERFIRNYLNKNNIKYITQKRFHDLKDKTYLSYDFYLPSYNTLIEYQGKQHYESIDYFGGEKQFNKQRLHDELKREYAKDNGYKLLELKYTLDTQDLIDKYLKRRIK